MSANKFSFCLGLVATLATFATPAIADSSSPPTAGTNRFYTHLKALNSGFFVQVGGASTKNGARVIQWDGPGAMHGQWEIAGYSDFGPIRNRWSRQCLDVLSNAIGALVVQNPCDGRSSQVWRIEQAGADYFYVINHYSGLDLNVGGAAIAIGANLIVWPRQYGAANTLFKIEFDVRTLD